MRSLWPARLHPHGYTYTPYGAAAANGDVTQPLQWSSEYADEELGLTYYNYRHYNPVDGRWVQRDILLEYADYSLFKFLDNIPLAYFDFLGTLPEGTKLSSVKIKRNEVLWKEIVGLGGESGDDLYGHWWVEFDNESYGWWPAHEVSYYQTLKGVRGRLNGFDSMHIEGEASDTQDYHHGETPHKTLIPKVRTRKWLLWDTVLQYGGSKGKKCKCASEEEIKDCMRKFAEQYEGSWQYPVGKNCHSFQESMLASCCLEV